MRLLIGVLLSLWLIAGAGIAQSDTDPENTASGLQEDSTSVDQSPQLKVDTLLIPRSGRFDAMAPITSSVNYEEHLGQNPTRAFFKSLLVPGLGQIGNRRYVKTALFAALDTWFIGSAIHYGRQAADFRSQFDETPGELITLRQELHGLEQDRRDERNKFTWFAVIVTLVSGVDAYVDAHLSGYPSQKQASSSTIGFEPIFRGKSVLASISLTF
ncbi:MAG: DUF5683 domain-containing protein [Candidatus Zixiibacteriota bacterium]